MNPDSPTPTLRQRFREQARTEVLDAAIRVFTRDGLKEARIDTVAAEAGVSVGTVYNLFGDRAGLVQAVVERGRTDVFARVYERIGASSGEAFEVRLHGMVHLLIDHMREKWSLLRVLSDGPCPSPGKAPPDAIREMHGTINRFLQEGIDAGVLAPTDSHVLTCSLMGAIRNTIDVDLALGLAPPSEDRADTILHLFLEGARHRR